MTARQRHERLMGRLNTPNLVSWEEEHLRIEIDKLRQTRFFPCSQCQKDFLFTHFIDETPSKEELICLLCKT